MHLLDAKCKHHDCRKRQYKREQCKKHFSDMVLKILRKELRNIYRGPDKAYSAMDFSGVGFITEEDFMQSIVVTRVKLSEGELRDFFFQANMFKDGMNFDQFKKTFFPHLYLIQEGNDSEEERKDKQLKKELK